MYIGAYVWNLHIFPDIIVYRHPANMHTWGHFVYIWIKFTRKDITTKTWYLFLNFNLSDSQFFPHIFVLHLGMLHFYPYQSILGVKALNKAMEKIIGPIYVVYNFLIPSDQTLKNKVPSFLRNIPPGQCSPWMDLYFLYRDP